jgi:carboxypeptidase C (cathepsin A)
MKGPVLLTLLLASGATAVIAQTPPPGTTQVTVQTPTVLPPADDASWIRTKHTATLAGKTVNYTATVGLMPIRNDNGDIEARMFFTAYHVDGAAVTAKRPITFAFNGGPGSASIYLHSGVLGPKRVKLLSDGSMPPPPYEMVENDESVIPETDLVMIDPIGTGYSRPEKPELGKKFYDVQGDIDSVGQFIKSFLTHETRLLSPVFVLGESYGGIRGSGLAKWLTDNGVGLNGLILVSPAINLDNLWGDPAYAFNIPTYTADAWYHHKLGPDLQSKSVDEVFRKSQDFVYNEFWPDLMRGSALNPEVRKKLIVKLASFTGLTQAQVEDCNLRIDTGYFFKELLRDRRYTIGRFDGRLLGIDKDWSQAQPDYDPSDVQNNGPIISTVTTYLREELGYKTTASFWQEKVGGDWKWEPFVNERAEALRGAMHQNPYLKLFVAMGYFDLACPATTVEQTLNQMSLDPRLAGNITRGYYPAGHMMYIDHDCRVKLHNDVANFIKMATNPTLPPKVKLIGGPDKGG